MKKSKKDDKKAVGVDTSALQVAIDFSGDEGKGFEGTGKDSFAIPFLTVLQGTSPQLHTVDGAKPGVFLNTISGEVQSTVKVILCAYEHVYVRWAPRSAGGGYKGQVSLKDVTTNAYPNMMRHEGSIFVDVPKGQLPVDEAGKAKYDQLVDTRHHFVLHQTKAGLWTPALLSMKSTQIKHSKQWMSMANGIRLPKPGTQELFLPPMWSHIYQLSTIAEKNEKGQWFGIAPAVVSIITDATLVRRAKEFNRSVSEGKVEATPTE